MRNLPYVTFYLALFVLTSRECGILCSEAGLSKSTNLRNGCTINNTLKDGDQTELNDTNHDDKDFLNGDEDLQEVIKEVQLVGGEEENIEELTSTSHSKEKEGNIRGSYVLSDDGIETPRENNWKESDMNMMWSTGPLDNISTDSGQQGNQGIQSSWSTSWGTPGQSEEKKVEEVKNSEEQITHNASSVWGRNNEGGERNRWEYEEESVPTWNNVHETLKVNPLLFDQVNVDDEDVLSSAENIEKESPSNESADKDITQEDQDKTPENEQNAQNVEENVKQQEEQEPVEVIQMPAIEDPEEEQEPVEVIQMPAIEDPEKEQEPVEVIQMPAIEDPEKEQEPVEVIQMPAIEDPEKEQEPVEVIQMPAIEDPEEEQEPVEVIQMPAIEDPEEEQEPVEVIQMPAIEDPEKEQEPVEVIQMPAIEDSEEEQEPVEVIQMPAIEDPEEEQEPVEVIQMPAIEDPEKEQEQSQKDDKVPKAEEKDGKEECAELSGDSFFGGVHIREYIDIVGIKTSAENMMKNVFSLFSGQNRIVNMFKDLAGNYS